MAGRHVLRWCAMASVITCMIDWFNLVNFLTLNMLNCFKVHKGYIHILNPILDLSWAKLMKLSLEQQYVLSVLHSQYHACWRTGDFRSQCISRDGIDPQSQNIPSPASENLTCPAWTIKEYSVSTRSVQCLLMPWPSVSQGHQLILSKPLPGHL